MVAPVIRLATAYKHGGSRVLSVSALWLRVSCNHGDLKHKETKPVSARVVSCYVFQTQMIMNGNIPYMLDFWDNMVVHLLLLNSTMVQLHRLFLK